MGAERLLPAQMALLFQFLGLLLYLLVVFSVFCCVIRVLATLVAELHGGEQIARYFRLIAANGFGLIVRPLIGGFLLVEQFLSGYNCAQRRKNCWCGGVNGALWRRL